MKNIRSTVLGIFMILGAVANAGIAVLDADPATNFDYGITAAAVAGGIAMIWMREEKQHKSDKQ